MFKINDDFKQFQSADIRLAFNVLPTIDYLNGTWIKGKRGEMILLGGFTNHTGIASKTNCGKSQLGLAFFVTALNRYSTSTGMLLETEGTMSISRPNGVSRKQTKDVCGEYYTIPTPEEVYEAMAEGKELNERVSFIDGSAIFFDKFVDKLVEISGLRKKLRGRKKEEVTLPMIYSRLHKDKMLNPHFVFIDSGTEADIESASIKQIKEGTDDKKDNLFFARIGLIKTKLFAKFPKMQLDGDIFTLTTASIDKQWGGQEGGMTHPEKMFTHLPQGDDIKGVGTNFKKLTSNLWTFGKPIVFTKGTASTDKTPKYPKNAKDNYNGNIDLELVLIKNLRGKAGPSGSPFPLVRSQSDGILSDCSMLETLRKIGKDDKFSDYGLVSTKQYCQALVLYSGLDFRNTNFREKIEEDFLAYRALEITFGLKMFLHVNPTVDVTDLMCTPEELYEDIKALGYDWTILLDTRAWWTFMEIEDKYRPYLSVYDLLRMRKKLYVPFWYKNVPEELKHLQFKE